MKVIVESTSGNRYEITELNTHSECMKLVEELKKQRMVTIGFGRSLPQFQIRGYIIE